MRPLFSPAGRPTGRTKGAVFWTAVSCIILCALGALLGTYKGALSSTGQTLGKPGGVDETDFGTGWVREEPVRIPPTADLKDVVTDSELYQVVVCAIPTWRHFKVGRALHAFRLWGPDAVFDQLSFISPYGTPTLTGEELKGLLLDHRQYQRFAPGEDPFLIDTKYGVAARFLPGHHGNFVGQLGHADDLLRACGELGLPKSTTIWTFARKARLVDVIREATARFDPDQEFSILQPQSRNKIESYFGDMCRTLEESQNDSGSWGKRWWMSSSSGNSPTRMLQDRNSRTRTRQSLASTAHHLEWIALAPKELRPTRRCVEKAVGYLVDEIPKIESQWRTELYLPITHAARALCLLRNRSPIEALEIGYDSELESETAATRASCVRASCGGRLSVQRIHGQHWAIRRREKPNPDNPEPSTDVTKS